VHFFARIKKTVLYTRHGNDTLRDWIKNLTCPCFGWGYRTHDIDLIEMRFEFEKVGRGGGGAGAGSAFWTVAGR
jgi:hypothetical protein